ncbi:ATP-binding protein, partial [Microcoleus sp. herbarium19]|uniref:sensor histidine kinase n=1 Tax=unclassified Microcoleus TaxID=2642155 RepID=UPI002FCFD577
LNKGGLAGGEFDESKRSIDNTLLILQHRLKAKANFPTIQIIKNYGQLPQVECYPSQLNQVFMNILSNAIDALESSGVSNHEQPRITIRTFMGSGDAIAISIADNGVGMPQSILGPVFDPLFTTKPLGKGTGLGLSISHQIITEKHGGKIECSSIPGLGTDFVVEIPVRHLVA